MKKTMLILIILASLIPGVLAVVQYYDNFEKEKESKQNELELKSKIDSLANTNSQLSKQISSLSKDNVELSKQLTETSIFLNDNVIGSAEISVWAFQAKPGEIKFRVKNTSKFPAYDVRIVIQDYDEIYKCQHSIENNTAFIDAKCFNANITFVESFTLNAGTEMELPYLFPIKDEYLHFAFQINTRKKLFIRQTVFKVDLGKFNQSHRIYEKDNDKLILKSEENELRLPKKYWDEHFFSQPYIRTRGFIQ